MQPQMIFIFFVSFLTLKGETINSHTYLSIQIFMLQYLICNRGLHLLYRPQRKPLKTGNDSFTMHDFITEELINQPMRYSEID